MKRRLLRRNFLA